MTPIQELIETIEWNLLHIEHTESVPLYNLGIKDTFKNIVAQCKEELLEKEKQMVIDVYEDGIKESNIRINAAMNMGFWEDINAETYFNNKYSKK